MESLKEELAAVREQAIEIARERKELMKTIEYIYFITEIKPGKFSYDICKEVNRLASKHIEL